MSHFLGSLYMKQIVFLFLLFLVCGFGLYRYAYKWNRLYRALKIDKVKDFAEEVAQQETEPSCPMPVRLFLPMLFLVLFVLELTDVFHLMEIQVADKVPLLFVLSLLAFPCILIVLLLKEGSKSVKVAFALSLFLALIMEPMVVGMVQRFLEGYYFEHGYRLKRLESWIFFLLLFAGTMYEAQVNWLKLYRLSKREKEEVTEQLSK